jgi:hypothetical protein
MKRNIGMVELMPVALMALALAVPLAAARQEEVSMQQSWLSQPQVVIPVIAALLTTA